jgi:hypothetical protein
MSTTAPTVLALLAIQLIVNVPSPLSTILSVKGFGSCSHPPETLFASPPQILAE